MGFFKKFLSTVGIGSAKVDTILYGDEFHPGDTVEGVVKISGGNVEQQIQGLYFGVHCNYEETRPVEIDEDEVQEAFDAEEEVEEERTITRNATLERFKISDNFVIGPEEEKEIPVSFMLPEHTPITLGKTKVCVTTGLDIQKALDAGDKDYIKVVPNGLVTRVFDNLLKMGFEMTEATCEAVSSKIRKDPPFVQEFEFSPSDGPFRGKLDELELVVYSDGDCIELVMDIDRKARDLGSLIDEMHGMDETRVKITLCSEDVDAIYDRLYEIIENWS